MNTDPRLLDKLKKPTLFSNKKMALTFVPVDAELPLQRAQIEINGVKAGEMITKLKTGAVRLQIASAFGEREIVFNDGAEVLFLYEMLGEFITGLPR